MPFMQSLDIMQGPTCHVTCCEPKFCEIFKHSVDTPSQDITQNHYLDFLKSLHVPSAIKPGQLPCGAKSIQGHRPSMEDTYCVHYNLGHETNELASCSVEPLRPCVCPQGLMLVGVFDGHGGKEAAQHCAKHMRAHFSAELLKRCSSSRGRSDLDSFDKSFDFEQLNKSPNASDSSTTSTFRDSFLDDMSEKNQNRRSSNEQYATDDVEAALHHAFIQVDDELSGNSVGECTGTTAVVAVLGEDSIWIAHCGDSRAVIQRGGVAESLTRDHKPDREDEAKRVRQAGGQIIFSSGSQRVMGMLAMSRAIGDHFLRPYVIPDPEVRTVARTPEDEVLVMATDGLWDVVSSSEATSLALKALRRVNDKGIRGSVGTRVAASVLVKLALERGSRDNVTVLVVDLSQRNPVSSTPVTASACGSRANAWCPRTQSANLVSAAAVNSHGSNQSGRYTVTTGDAAFPTAPHGGIMGVSSAPIRSLAAAAFKKAFFRAHGGGERSEIPSVSDQLVRSWEAVTGHDLVHTGTCSGREAAGKSDQVSYTEHNQPSANTAAISPSKVFGSQMNREGDQSLGLCPAILKDQSCESCPMISESTAPCHVRSRLNSNQQSASPSSFQLCAEAQEIHDNIAQICLDPRALVASSPFYHSSLSFLPSCLPGEIPHLPLGPKVSPEGSVAQLRTHCCSTVTLSCNPTSCELHTGRQLVSQVSCNPASCQFRQGSGKQLPEKNSVADVAPSCLHPVRSCAVPVDMQCPMKSDQGPEATMPDLDQNSRRDHDLNNLDLCMHPSAVTIPDCPAPQGQAQEELGPFADLSYSFRSEIAPFSDQPGLDLQPLCFPSACSNPAFHLGQILEGCNVGRTGQRKRGAPISASVPNPSRELSSSPRKLFRRSPSDNSLWSSRMSDVVSDGNDSV